MSPQACEKAPSLASSETSIDNKQNKAAAGEEISCVASPNPLISHQQTEAEEALSSASPERLIVKLQIARPSNAVEDPLQKQIICLVSEIRQLKLKQDPKRERMKHALLQEELAQLREKNLNLRADLRLVQEKHQALESEHHKYKEQMKETIEKVMGNLSAGLDLSKGASINVGVKTEGVALGLNSLPPQKSVTGPKVEKATGAPSVLQGGIQAKIFGQNPLSFFAAQNSGSPPSISQHNQPNVPKPPSFDFSSNPFATKPSPATATVTGPPGPLRVKKPASSKFGDPERMVLPEGDGSTNFYMNTPGSCNNREQSFEEARLRRYETPNGRFVNPLKQGWLNPFGTFEAPTHQVSFGGASVFEGLFQQSKKGKMGEAGGGSEGQASSSANTAGISKVWFPDPAKPEGSGTANVTPASSDTKKDPTASPYGPFSFGR